MKEPTPSMVKQKAESQRILSMRTWKTRIGEREREREKQKKEKRDRKNGRKKKEEMEDVD